MTNSIRRDVATSLQSHGEVRNPSRTLKIGGQSDAGTHNVVGDGKPGRYGGMSRETCSRGDVGKGQSLHSADAAMAVESVEGKPAPREGRQEGGCVKSNDRQRISYVSPVPRRGGTKQDTETGSWVEASIWTERMSAALENGVKRGKWFSLIDKVTRLQTLEIAWQKVAAKGCLTGCPANGVHLPFFKLSFFTIMLINL